MEENWKNPLLLEKKTLNMSMYTEFEFKINGVACIPMALLYKDI